MDLNLIVLSGRLAVDPEIKTFDSGSRLARLLLTVRQDNPPRRVDVLPVTVWSPPASVESAKKGDRVWATGSMQRQFWDAPDGRRSRVELVAETVTFGEGIDYGEEE